MSLKTLAIIPAYNEAGKVRNVVRKTLHRVDCVLVVDDGSKDRTAREAQAAGAVVVVHAHNQGVGAAIRSGIDYALQHQYEVCIPLGGDDQDNPAEISRLMRAIEQGYDFVQGSRYLRGGRIVDAPLFRILTTKMYSWFFSFVAGRWITDASNGFRAFRVSIFGDGKINLWQDWLNRYEMEPYFFNQVIKKGYRVIEVPVTKRYLRKQGYSKMKPFKDWWRITRPLVFLWLGLRK